MATIEKSGFMGNVERAIAAGKLPELSKVTADKPVKIAENDGVTYYKSFRPLSWGLSFNNRCC